MRTIGVEELADRAAEIVQDVHDNGESYVVTVKGKVLAKVQPFSDLDIEVWQNEIDDWLARVDVIAREIGAIWPKGVSAAEAVAEQRREL
jgi:antitoxin (DNA-binding transcriptional repressor) of toxin-antitoxin stability system